jgi:ATP-dependent Lhr-like helicase
VRRPRPALPRRRPDRRQPLWQQRQRAAQLLEVASQYPVFPIVLEAVRECVQDVFDVPGLVALMAPSAREVTAVDRETPAVPFARSLLFGYVAQFLYEGDSPLAERRAAALTLDPTLLAELLGRGEGCRCAICSTRGTRADRGRVAAPHPRARGPRRRGSGRPVRCSAR